ncbi:Regulatory protein [Dirofilaria immitis]
MIFDLRCTVVVTLLSSTTMQTKTEIHRPHRPAPCGAFKNCPQQPSFRSCSCGGQLGESFQPAINAPVLLMQCARISIKCLRYLGYQRLLYQW